MPHIDPTLRPKFLSAIQSLPRCVGPGEFNYIITQICLKYIRGHERRYETMAVVRGVLMDVHDELKRRIMDPYEDQKAVENGDAYKDE